MTRPSSATGTPGRSRACARASSPSRWSMAGRRARARRSRRSLVGDSPSKPFGGGRGSRLERRRPHPLFHPARGRPDRAQLDQSRHLCGAGRRQRRAGQPHRRQSMPPTARRPSRPTGAGSPTRRWRGRPTRPTARSSSCATSQTGETRALTGDWDRSVGSIAWAPDGRSLLVTAGDTLDTPLFRVDIPQRPGHPAHPGRHGRAMSCRCATAPCSTR